jgi:2-polyprenyl-6-methoxyphenol hydroxylase-like FAD-dependent oxidoreductase
MAEQKIEVQCCIAGGGPAGMMLGFLLARAGVNVLVLEKHADFLRDFRGDTVHPSTLEVMAELGLLEDFLRRPHQELATIGAQIGAETVQIADLRHLPTRCRFVAMMPQWDFLDFIAGHAKRLPAFALRMQAKVTGLIEEGGRISGVRAETPDGELIVRAGLVVGADGRHSTVRSRAGLEVINLGAPIDVLWMRLSRRQTDPGQSLGRVIGGALLVTIDRGDYWQCAFVIHKGGFDTIRRNGLSAFRAAITALAPHLADRVHELRDWSDIKLLSVSVDRLRRWHRPGLLCIGDAAHAMSPIGGVGINLAIQDAVAAANILSKHFRNGTPGEDVLHQVQRRRTFATRATQRLQLMVQTRIIAPVLGRSGALSVPLALRLLQRWPVLQRIPARLIGLGFTPEHVRSALRS